MIPASSPLKAILRRPFHRISKLVAHQFDTMKATTFAIIFPLAVAQPYRQHQYIDRHHKRADPPVVWVTESVSTTTTIDITTTIWVSEGYVAPTSEAKAATTQPSSSTASSSVEQTPAQFFEPASSQKPSSTSLVALAYVPTTTSPAVAATTSAKALLAGSSSGTCSTRSPCTGEMTYYDISANEYGSCGYQGIDGTKDKIVAISAQLMGSVSNGNPMCGKTVTVKGINGKTVVAKVIDKCPSCVAHAIDLSRAAFTELDSLDVGRINVNWWFNE
ncbi:riboflavin aldehyde-forming enzyme [Halenospora varia]|nr:riboflavin aldehyde-forming enzyme [Halenospora varia]